MSDTWLFLLRTGLISIAGLLLGSTAVVMVAYLRAWLRRGATKWQGLLPLHVFVVMLSYDLLVVYATSAIIDRINSGQGYTWRIFLVAPAFLLGLVAMVVIMRFRQQRRLHEDV